MILITEERSLQISYHYYLLCVLTALLFVTLITVITNAPFFCSKSTIICATKCSTTLPVVFSFFGGVLSFFKDEYYSMTVMLYSFSPGIPASEQFWHTFWLQAWPCLHWKENRELVLIRNQQKSKYMKGITAPAFSAYHIYHYRHRLNNWDL